MTGLTDISKITAFQTINGEKVPCEGELLYRGYDVKDLIAGMSGRKNKYEEAAYLLLFGELPSKQQLTEFKDIIAENMTLPTNFTRDVIMKAPDSDIMSSMTKSILTLASYDTKKNDLSIESVLRQTSSLQIWKRRYWMWHCFYIWSTVVVTTLPLRQGLSRLPVPILIQLFLQQCHP